MANATVEDASDDTEVKKSLLMPIIIGLVGALAAGGGSFFVAYSGLLGGDSDKKDSGYAAKLDDSVAFVPLDPLVISLGGQARARHLKFAAQLEVDPAYKEEIEALQPRVVDVLNTFLRAVDEAELEEPTAMVRLRAQMLRRIQVVTGEGRVKDLLIVEFVLN